MSALVDHLGQHAKLPGQFTSAEKTDWPPQRRSSSDLDELRVILTRMAYELIGAARQAGSEAFGNDTDRAQRAHAAAAHAMAVAKKAAGYGEAAGTLRFKRDFKLGILQRALDEGVKSPEELFRRAGLSRSTGFEYLRELKPPSNEN